MNSISPKNIDEYIDQYPENISGLLQKVRDVIREAAPDAEEKISYGMPAFAQEGILVYFAAAKSHLGFYPTSSGIEQFKHEFGTYKWSKGAVQFPYNKPIPFELIRRIVQFRIAENLLKAEARKKKSK